MTAQIAATTDSAASAANDAAPGSFYSPARVRELTTLSQPSIWRRTQAGKFPRPVSLGGNRVGYRVEAVAAWLAAPTEWKPIREDGTA